MSNNSLEIQLVTPIEVSVGGNVEQADSLFVSSPSASNFKTISKLKSVVAKTIMALQASESLKNQQHAGNESSDESSPDAAAVNQILYAFSETEYCEIADMVKQILLNGAATMNGQKFESGMYLRLSFDDVENVTGSYIAHFLL